MSNALEFLLSEYTVCKLIASASDNYSDYVPVHEDRLTIDQLCAIPMKDLYNIGFRNLNRLLLLPLWSIKLIADGQQLIDIFDDTITVTKDTFHFDTCRGLISVGFVHPDIHKLNRKKGNLK